MSIIYNVTIEAAGAHNRFRVTWLDVEKNSQDYFDMEATVTPEEIKHLWRYSNHQLPIGQKLFRFLDGDARHFMRVLDRADREGEMLQVRLWTCEQTADWPFELLAADNAFLLPHRLHLVRCVSNRGEKKKILARDRHLKLLFMACSAMDVKPRLDLEGEEEAIFRITDRLPVHMEIEDSGSLDGLHHRLEQECYDVVHLSGHADIDETGSPYFIMEDEAGRQCNVSPDDLWHGALIENPPRLLFLSGCRTGEAPGNPDGTDAVSFARLMVETFHVPAALGWGRSVRDDQAVCAEKMLFHELSRGRSIPGAIRRVRYELLKNFARSANPAWPLLRLFSSGAPLEPMIKKGLRWRPKPRQMKHIYLGHSRVRVLAEGFVGRRRQLQTGLRMLKQVDDNVGILILGAGGLGKSCLAGKICERFPDHTLIAVNGKLNAVTLEAALTHAFVGSQDEKSRHILSRKVEMADKLTDLCAVGFKEKNYLLLLDGFHRNLEGWDSGQPGPLTLEAADLLKTLLRYLPFSGKMTQLIITSRYDFSLTLQGRNLVEERLEKVWLTGFPESEQLKKAIRLKNTLKHKDFKLMPCLLAAGRGNPLLMEWLDQLVGRMPDAELPGLSAAMEEKKEDFIRRHLLRELLHSGGEALELFLRCLSIYHHPVPVEEVQSAAEKAGLYDWKKLLRKGMLLSLIEHDQVRLSYRVTPLLREEWSNGTPGLFV